MADVYTHVCKYKRSGHYYYLNLPIVISPDWHAMRIWRCPLSVRLLLPHWKQVMGESTERRPAGRAFLGGSWS